MNKDARSIRLHKIGQILRGVLRFSSFSFRISLIHNEAGKQRIHGQCVYGHEEHGDGICHDEDNDDEVDGLQDIGSDRRGVQN